VHSFSIGFTEINKAGPAWPEYWALRKKEFIDVKGWDLPHTENFEFDWYDRPGARWIIVTENGHCVGGARILATNAPSYGSETYMLRDAKDGLITGIPMHMLPAELPQDPKLFEATRFFVDRNLGPKAAMNVQKEVVRRTVEAALNLGGDRLIALMPCKIYRIFRRFGFEVIEHTTEALIDDVPHSVGWLTLK